MVAARTRKFFRSIRRLATPGDSAIGKRESASDGVATGRVELETDLQRGMQNLHARPARTRQNDRRSGAGNFSRLAQASERCLVRVANFTATKPNGSGRDGSRCGGVGRITGKRARSQFSARAAGEGKR